MDATPSRLGQANGASDVQALFLEKFSGRVLLKFERMCKARARTTVETEDWGKAVVISEIGDTGADTHQPGAEILGDTIPQGERKITPEDLVVASAFIADWDRFINHFQAQDKYATKLAQAIANRYDRDLFRVMIQAATATTANPALLGKEGTSIGSDSLDPVNSGADLIVQALAAAQVLDEKDVPDNDNRTLWVTAAQYWLLVGTQGNEIVNRDFGGEGSVARGVVTRVGNLEIVKSNNLKAVIDGGNSQGSVDTNCDYLVDASNTAALVTTPDSVMTGEWLGVTSEAGYDMRRQGTLLISKVVKGSGILRPECAVNIEPKGS